MENFRDFNFDISMTDSESSDDNLEPDKRNKVIKKPKNCIQMNCTSFNEIKKLREECYNIQNKCYVINYHTNTELLDLKEKLDILNGSKNKAPYTYNNYLGQDLENLSFEKLIDIEHNLVQLLSKAIAKTSSLQSSEINSEYKKINNECTNCKKENIDVIIRPCNHFILCNKCVETLIKCPKCKKIITFCERIFMPSN